MLVEFAGLACPLTPLEVHLRRSAGGVGYGGGFIDHYVGAVVYPAGLTRGIQLWLGTLVMALNALVYGVVIGKAKAATATIKSSRARRSSS